MEEWKDIKGYEGLYQISNMGRVKSLYGHGRILKFGIGTNGYLFVNLFKDNKIYITYIHRIVAQYFVNNPENKPEVNHDDGNKANNNDWNLIWNTRTENQNHAIDTGLRKQHGENSHYAKLCNDDIIAIRSLKDIVSRKDIATQYNVTINTIRNILLNKTWKHLKN